ncbi:ribosome maturation factor RimM [Paracidobacterium acidisoli]|uniref:Ribosome maturation factor RimM n=1 Tax=Paracidobacterium acidisoli TaxID=2303751 RepID=A0A372IJJ0_9BACT|nr:ribosome maturation factor RimM [Paracidobacterium acidisoli]MBT9333042.1 ribosome maturation factor RimM [Paracidobacterium acidisoli]
MPPSDWVIVARLLRTHGRRGEIIADILTDFPERFEERRRLFLIPPERLHSRPREIELESHWFFRSKIVFKFKGIESINDAEPLRGFEVAVPQSERAPLEEGSVYVGDLIGCHVIDLGRNGVDIGEVVDVDSASSSTSLLVVRRPSSGPGKRKEQDALIPFAKAWLEAIDVEQQRIEMRLPAGLLEINAPMTKEEQREIETRNKE